MLHTLDKRSQHAFHGQVVGPHFEEICRQRTRWHAGPQTYGGAYLFGGAGFSDALMRRAATDPSAQLIGLDRLYYGS